MERKCDKEGEVGEVKFGERVFIKRARGDRESRRDTWRERDRQIETEDFKTEETLERHPGREEVFFLLFIRLSHTLFLAHFPDCKTLSIGQPYEVTI